MTATVHAPSLSGVLGQPRAIETLRASMRGGRVHHAWVFAGPQGVGKRTTAEAFAAALLDPTTAPNLSGDIEPDPDSQVQRLIAAGAHPDLHIITKELAAYSDDAKVRSGKQVTIAKDVIEKRLLTPIALASTLRLGGLASKVFIIDEAELLDRSRTNAPVQNALLKTLEEPPAGAVIILVTSAEEALLPTIRSRCQRVVFQPLDDASMSAWLGRAGLEVDADERRWLMSFACGSPGRALLAAEGGLYDWHRTLEPMLRDAERGVYSPSLGQTMAKLIEEWAKAAVASKPTASKEAANIAGTRLLLSMLSERRRMRLRDAAARDLGAAERELRALDAIDEAERQVAAAVTITNAMEFLSAQLSA